MSLSGAFHFPHFTCFYLPLLSSWCSYIIIKSIKKRVIMAKSFGTEDLNRIIEMAWEDRTPFEAIDYQFNLKENDVRKIMRSHLSNSSFKMWRKRVAGRKTKHQSTSKSTRFKSKNQK